MDLKNFISTVEKLYNPYTNEAGGYSLTLMDSTKMSVPNDVNNRHYKAVQEWIADGGTVIDNPPE